MEDHDKPILKKFLLSNTKRYSAKDISKKFLKGKYTQQQIIAFSVKNHLSFCLVKSKRAPLSQSQCDAILQLAKEGKATQEIASILNIPIPPSVWQTRVFCRQGLIPRVPTWKRSGVRKPSSRS